VTAAHALVAALARASLGGALLAGLAVATARAFPRMPAAARGALLWLGCARLLLALVPAPAVEIPILPAPASHVRHERVNRVISAASTAEPGVSSSGPRARSAELPVGNDAPAELHDAPAELPVVSEFLWVRLVEAAALATWAAGAALSLVRLARERRRAREIVRGAETVPPGHPARDMWRALGGERRGALGLLPAPRLALSPTVRAPLCAGLLQPTVVLPTAPLPERALRAALAHELGHLRRGDLWLAWVPALAEALLWFHPLARLAAREHAQAREEACDAFALRRAGVDPADYGPLLVAFGTGHRRLALAAAAGAPHVRQLERRLLMLLHVPTTRRARLATAAALLLAAPGLVPVALGSVATPADARAGSAAPARVAQADSPTPSTSAPAVPASHPALPAPADVPGDLPLSQSRPTPPLPPTPPRPPGALAKAPPPPPPPLVGADFLVYTDGENDWIMTDGDDADVAEARALTRGRKGPVLVFGRGGKRYVVEDRAALEPFRALFQDSAGLDAEQARAGLEQARIGRERAELERRRADVDARRADLEVARAEADVQAASGQMGRKALERQGDDLARRMDALGTEMDAIGREADGLGRRMDDIGRRMEQAGRRSEDRARKAQDRATSMLGGWIRSGVARPVGPGG